MTTYIMLANLTDAGTKSVRDSPHRLDTAKRLLKDMGGEFKSSLLTMGEYDFIAVYDAPDDAIAARFTLQLGTLGKCAHENSQGIPGSRLPRDRDVARRASGKMRADQHKSAIEKKILVCGRSSRILSKTMPPHAARARGGPGENRECVPWISLNRSPEHMPFFLKFGHSKIATGDRGPVSAPNCSKSRLRGKSVSETSPGIAGPFQETGHCRIGRGASLTRQSARRGFEICV